MQLYPNFLPGTGISRKGTGFHDNLIHGTYILIEIMEAIVKV